MSAPPPGERASLPPLDAFIQAGGRSRRMGQDKALLELGGRTLLERVAAAVRPVAGRVVLVTGRPDAYRRFGLPMLPDRWPDAGALGGIGTALTHAGTERALVVACDLPFLTSALLAFLAGLDPAADVTLCETEAEGIHPLCAVYSRRCLPHIERRVAEGRLKVAGFFDAVTVRAVGETEMRAHGFTPDLLANLNTPEEYERARRALAGEAGREGKPA